MSSLEVLFLIAIFYICYFKNYYFLPKTYLKIMNFINIHLLRNFPILSRRLEAHEVVLVEGVPTECRGSLHK